MGRDTRYARLAAAAAALGTVISTLIDAEMARSKKRKDCFGSQQIVQDVFQRIFLSLRFLNQFLRMVNETVAETNMIEHVFIGLQHEMPLFEDSGIQCVEPAPGRAVERVLLERKRRGLIVMTRDFFFALPDWLIRDFLEWTPDKLFVVPQVPQTNAEKRPFSHEVNRKELQAEGLGV